MKILKSLLAAAVLWAGAAQAQYVMPGVWVDRPPPVERVEPRPYQPSANHIWVNGHWAWRYGRHEWLRGHWALPPAPGYHWVQARWVNEGGRWHFFEGHWLPPANPVYVEPTGPEVFAEVEPPAAIVEQRSPQPGPNYIWAPGYWHWQEGRHVWVGGYWIPRREGFHWAAHRWERRGNRWVFVRGGWVR